MRRSIVAQNYSTGCFLAGIAIGVGIGMLMAPSTGADAREYIRDRAKDWKDRAEEFVDEGKNYLQREGRQAGESVEAARTAYDERRS
jgi:gas vesicle protein